MTVETRPPADWTSGYVDVADGVRLHYDRSGGAGPPLVIAHGVFDDGRCRLPLARELADDYDVIVYDARGHGHSDAPESGYDADARAADLIALLEGLGVDDPIFFGHSMGGDTVLAAAADYPDRPRAVVAVDPACLLGHNAENRGDDRMDDAEIEGIRQRILWWQDHSKAELLDADDELAGHVAAGDEELASLLADARLRVSPDIVEVFASGWVDPGAAFPEIEAPTLVLRADVDEEARERDRAAVDRLPDGRLVHVDDAGHCVFRDRRESATGELRSFLDEV
ncbi:alpha/beta fold hydrolase [Halosimplex pelagicum]|uniref:Alpha/beta hydrolase n=1 Tax=Halosimplex pelagicum TaxID=869886 RepID=A0A7D5TSS8_9EURY|nr:alpha/beta hydrolase [Halosimplex pelagicum]QLH80834.1 alpha/beta hydrolase [Halosimplex pelagicum]